MAVTNQQYDFGIIGAGFFGVRLALLLDRMGFRVLILDREKEICSRASYVNQARVHNGYHYPRSLSTALGSHKNYQRFQRELPDCIDDSFDHCYAIARQGSFTNAYQFERFCKELDLSLRPVPSKIRKLFNKDRIEEVFLVREGAFNALSIRSNLSQAMDRSANIKRLMETDCTRLDLNGKQAVIHTSRGNIKVGGVFIVTYAEINSLLFNSVLNPLDLKAEITEVCLVDVPINLSHRAVTIMDGPFFSLMPMPAEQAYSLTHVRYTPHVSWDLKSISQRPYAIMDRYEKNNRFLYMKKDAQRYIPEMEKLTYRGSLFEVKTVPNKHEIDDGRPIVFHKHSEDPLCISVLGSKIDSIFELEDTVEDYFRDKGLS